MRWHDTALDFGLEPLLALATTPNIQSGVVPPHSKGVMTTLILGSTGQLGTAFRRLLPDAVCWTRQQADLARPESLRRLVIDAKPAVVLNCAAVQRRRSRRKQTWPARSR